MIVNELVQLSARIDAATQRQLALIREVYERELWGVWGAKTCAHFLAWRLGLSPGAARERLRVAIALGELPHIEAALGAGRISFSKVRAMTRVATPENDAALVDLARHATAAQLERICRGMRQVQRDHGSMREPPAPFDPCDRDVEVRADADGSTRLTVRVLRDEAARVMAVLERVRAALRREAGSAARPDRADALLRMAQLAERVLEAESADVSGSTPSVLADDPPETPLPGAGVPAETPLASAAVPTKASSEVPAKPSHAPRARTGADHALVAFHLQPEMLAEGFTALLDDGTRVPAETFRRVACDCAMVGTLEHGGEVLDVGRRSRAISAGMRRALDRRDAGCRFPGCDCTRFLHAHHIEHWALGGETSLSNLVSLCPFHHRLAHEGGYRVHAGDDAPVFTTPRGHIIPAVPAETRPTGDLRDAVGRLRIDDDPRDTLHWVQRPDYGYVVQVMMQ